jgi:hypothetical protein
MHLSRFRFPHCKTRSDDVVCLLGSKLVLWALLLLVVVVVVMVVLLVLPLLVLLNESFSIYSSTPVPSHQ